MASRTKAELETLVRQQRERIQQLEREDSRPPVENRRDDHPPRLRILELPSEWESRNPDMTRSPFVLVIDRDPDEIVDVDAVTELAEDIDGCRGILAFRAEIQLGEDWDSCSQSSPLPTFYGRTVSRLPKDGEDVDVYWREMEIQDHEEGDE